MHPGMALILWVMATLAVQGLQLPGLGALALLAWLAVPALIRILPGYLRRVRWLVLTLWLVMAYGRAGDAVADLAWLPTWEGIGEANLHTARLLVTLICLACLNARLSSSRLIAGLWTLCRPFRHAGVDVERLVVRLMLVLESLAAPPQPGGWRQFMLAAPLTGGTARLSLAVECWRRRDTLCVLGVLGVAAGVMVWWLLT